MNYKYAFFTTLFVSGVIALASRTAPPQEMPRTPADGHEIHVLAPHQMDGKVMGLTIITARLFRAMCSNA